MIIKNTTILLLILLLALGAMSIAQAQERADLVVAGEITRLQKLLFPGNVGVYRVNVANIGNAKAENVKVVMKFNQAQQCSTYIYLDPGEIKSVWCGYSESLVGELFAEAIIDSAYSVPETNEDNNSVSNKFYITSALQRPDIKVVNITTNPISFHTGDDVLFSVNLINNSKWPTDEFATAWYLDDNETAICLENMDLEPGATKTNSCLVSDLEFNRDFKVHFVADEHDRLAETEEKNNSQTNHYTPLSARENPFEQTLGSPTTVANDPQVKSSEETSDEIVLTSTPLFDESIVRNFSLEAQVWDLHLANLLIGLPVQPFDIETQILKFVTYGVDENTAMLGIGERAAVLYSYKEAYGKIPSNAAEMDDITRIASGRWPVELSLSAQNRAHSEFFKIYRRIADMSNPHDNAAITIMAYGLRQKAVNRNLDSEKKGIATFISIYGHMPLTTAEWNIMQAITYSGASR
jgi:hypothetical protein